MATLKFSDQPSNFLTPCSTVFMVILALLFCAGKGQGQTVKGSAMQMHRISLKKKAAEDQREAGKHMVGFVSRLPLEQSDNETRKAYEWINQKREFPVEFITLKDILKRPGILAKYSVLWFHRPDTTALSGDEVNKRLLTDLKTYVENGGRLLLSLRYVHYLNDLGFEKQIIEDSTKKCIDEGYGRKLGFHAFREHPVFNGMNGGAYIYRPVTDITTRISGFFGDHVPQNGKVAGIDWDYIFLRESTKIILEYTPGKGKVLAVGGYINFSGENLNRAHLELFAS
ncbi:MAG: DUF4960 domain-containing protein, partial [Bacteroidota bacterium]